MIANDKTIWIRFSAALIVSLLSFSIAAAQKPKRKKIEPALPPAPVVTAEELKELSDAASKSREGLLAASNAYRESLQRLMELQKQDEERASVTVEKNKKLLEIGVLSRREVEESEQILAAAKAKLGETEKQIESVDHLVAEVEAAEELANQPPPPTGEFQAKGVMVRFVGLSRWNLSDFGKVDAFYRLKFGKPLPVSAFGQTETHNRLGFDHSNALDVAIHPDSAEGQALIEFLHGQGISFIAIRGAIHGSSTGAHIHIGASSRRIIPKQ
jgi:hypothetical protein